MGLPQNSKSQIVKIESLQEKRWHFVINEIPKSIFQVSYRSFHNHSVHVFSFEIRAFVTFLCLFEIERFETAHRGPSEKAQSDVIFSDLPLQISNVLCQFYFD